MKKYFKRSRECRAGICFGKNIKILFCLVFLLFLIGLNCLFANISEMRDVALTWEIKEGIEMYIYNSNSEPARVGFEISWLVDGSGYIYKDTGYRVVPAEDTLYTIASMTIYDNMQILDVVIIEVILPGEVSYF